MADGNDVYGEMDLAVLRAQAASIKAVAAQLGISEKALAGSFAEEINEWNATSWTAAKNGVLDLITTESHAEILANYNEMKQFLASGGDPRELGFGLPDGFDIIAVKYLNVALRDLGFGNIRAITAIDVLFDYVNSHPNSDPLGLKQYSSNLDNYLSAISDGHSDVSAKVGGLVVLQGTDWLSSHVYGWSSMAASDKDALLVFYYNVGREYMQELYDAAPTVNGEKRYIPNLENTDIAQDHLRNEQKIEDALANPLCFAAGTPILMADGTSKSIEDIQIGDRVASFYAESANLSTPLASGIVVRKFHNATTEWLAVTSANSDGIMSTIYATPGHRFQNEHGHFEALQSILERGGSLVTENGELLTPSVKRIEFTALTADKFEKAELWNEPSLGALALASRPEPAWKTYNFEVTGTHTYVAGGWRVHNDSQVYIDFAGAIGQTLGSQLGMMLTADESQFTQLVAGTALGVVTRNLAEVIMDTGFHLFTGDQLDFGASLGVAIRQLEDVNIDLATAAAGTVSSFLLAELGEALGLDGFGAELFNVTAGAYAGSVLNTAIANIATNKALLSGADFTNALGVLPGAVGTFFGSTLAREILPADSIQGSIGGSLGSIAGSALGSSALGGTLGQSLGVFGNFLLPGVGAFFGTLIGTFLGNLFGDDPDPHAAIDLFVRTGLSVDRGGLLEVVTQYESVDGFPHDATIAWAEAVHEVSRAYLETVGGFDLANALVSGLEISDLLIEEYGFYEGELVRLLQQMRIDVDSKNNMKFFVNDRQVASAEQMVDGAIAGFVKGAQVIGGDLLLKRAAANSSAVDTPTLSGDMAVAEQYAKYLNDRVATNALIASNPDSIFAAGWAINLAQSADLDLAKTNVTDFHGGLGGFLASLAYAGVSVNASDVTLSQNTTTKAVTIDIRLGDDIDVPGVVDVFADNVEVLDISGGRILRLTFADFMKNVGYNRVTGTSAVSGGLTNVTGESTGRDLWFAPGSANYVFEDTGNRIISVGDPEIISSDDILVGGAGADRLSGAEGWDWIVGGAGNDTLDGGSEADTLLGGDGNDTLKGGWDLDYLEGGAGADTLIGGDYELDWDTAGYAASNAAVTINLKTGAASGGHATGDVLSGILNLVGSKYNDRLTGNEYRNSLEGGAGADVLDGGANSSSDIYDFASYFRASKGVVASLADRSINTGDAAGDTYINIRGLEGSAFDDVLYGDANGNSLWGHGGNDILVVGLGADFAYGSFGFDIMSYRSLTSAITLNLENWDASSAVVKDDWAIGIEGFEATEYNDVITGRSTDSEGGASRNDVIFALGGNDNIQAGAGDDLIDAGAGNDTLNGGAGADTMRGGAGNDTYVVDNVGDIVDEATAGSSGTDTVQSSISFSLVASKTMLGSVENLTLTGTGNINGTGDAGNNTLIGNAGSNRLNGGAGADTMRGGAGNDIYVVDNVGDIVDEAATGSAGTDTVQSAITYSLVASTTLLGTVENLTLTGTGNINGTGNTGNNLLVGNAGNNTLNGGAGVDTMRGGAGNDIYVVDNVADIVDEAATGSAGTDTVQSAITYSLVASTTLLGTVENLTLLGTGNINGTGNAGNNVITGNSGNNVLLGDAGNDTLNGGAGVDTMRGGAGNDIYVVDNVGDIVDEAVAGSDGTDTVQSAITYSLVTSTTLLGTVENLTLTGTANINGTGNAGNNVLAGNSGNNTLIGDAGNDTLNGGAGTDTMRGGAGNDIYVVDSVGDVVDEAATGSDGTDTIQSSINYSLVASTTLLGAVENLTLLGTANINGTGNAGNNVLTGNSGNNTLVGDAGNDTLNGGAGADTMRGGAGNDIYVVDNVGDIVDEAATGSAGTDTVQSAITYSLVASTTLLGAVENLTLTGTANINGTGNSGNNLVIGNTGNNTLNGGAGADTMRGGAGNDIYVVDNVGDIVDEAATGSAGTDTIQSSITYSLAASSTVLGVLENLTLTGTTNINGTGNASNNALLGNSGNNVLIGDAGNDTLNGAAGADTMRGGAGNDTYYVDNVADIVDESETGSDGADTVRSSINYSLVASTTLLGTVENLTLLGTGNINGTGNAGNNLLTGNTGNNTLDGGAGADTMQGGAGNDIYVVDNVGDIVDEAATGSAGTDTVQSSITYSLVASTTLLGTVENLTLTGSANINGTGNTGNNLLVGNAGNNTLNGGAGVDTMRGGAGNDIYVVDNVADIVDEAATGSAGTDTVQSAISYSLVASTTLLGTVENLTLLGTGNINGTGNAGNNVITGNSGNNILIGDAGNDTLNGGAGVDTMRGGAGNDIYVIDNVGDVVDEAATGSDGTDTVQSAITYSLFTSTTLLGTVENLTLTGTANINGTGNAGNNVLTGNSGNNTLIGDAGNDTLNGGAGVDTMRGGAGNDIYVVDNVADIVDEAATGSSGTDTVQSSITYSLATSTTLLGTVENLTLLGTGNINGTGNSGNNVLTGNSGNNVLVGDAGNDTLNGGAGADTMRGGAGNDIYIVDNVGDIVDEAATGSSGTDTVQSSITYSLATSALLLGTVENLTLLGTGNINGTGNAGNNALAGNSGNNILIGDAGNDTLNGGAGADTMSGGVGNDVFVFRPGFGLDIVNDFVAGAGVGDMVEVANSVFADFEAVLAAAAQVGADTIITHDAANIITLKNVALASLHEDDFRFVA